MDSTLSALLSLLSAMSPQHEETLEHHFSTKKKTDRYSLVTGCIAIVGKTVLKKAISACFHIPTISHAEAMKRCLPLENGYYDETHNIYFLDEIFPQHIQGATENIGLVTGKPEHSGITPPSLLAGKSTFTHAPLEFGLTVKSGLIYRGTRMQMKPVANATFLQSVYYNGTQHFDFSKKWMGTFDRIERNIRKANSRKLHFVSGDGVTYALKNQRQVRECFSQRVGFSESEKSDIYFVPFSEFNENPGIVSKIILSQSSHIVLYSEETSAPQFLELLCEHYSIDFAIEHLNGYVAMRAVPELCSECRMPGKNGETLDDRMFNKPERIERHFERGQGCDSCQSGYVGVTWAEESYMPPGSSSKALLEYRSGSDYADAGFSIQKLYDKLVSSQSPTLSRSILSLIEQGTIQIEDANRIML